MKRLLSFFFSFVLFFCSFSVFSEKDNTAPSVSAQSYVLYCPDNKEVLLGRGLNTPAGMASTTKIMTSLLALEYAEKEDKAVEFTSKMQAEGSSMYLKAGDRVRLSDLAKGMMTVSGNDAANAAAVAVSGNTEDFAELMNKRAKEIGMENTCFKNPSGLSAQGHFSTPYDMALLMSEAMENQAFEDMTAKKSVTVDFVKPEGQRATYNNHNRLLSMYEYCIGGKTGYTKASGRCLVTCSEKNNLRLVAVTFNAPSDWQDHIKLYDYGFEKLGAVLVGDSKEIYKVNVIGSSKKNISAKVLRTQKFVSDCDTAKEVKTQVYMKPMLFAPVKKGDIVGKVVCTLKGKVVTENEILAQEDAGYMEISFFLRFFRSLFR